MTKKCSHVSPWKNSLAFHQHLFPKISNLVFCLLSEVQLKKTKQPNPHTEAAYQAPQIGNFWVNSSHLVK